MSAAIGALPDGDVKLLRGPERLWRLRVGEWRVIFARRDAVRVIDVLAVRYARPRVSALSTIDGPDHSSGTLHATRRRAGLPLPAASSVTSASQDCPEPDSSSRPRA